MKEYDITAARGMLDAVLDKDRTPLHVAYHALQLLDELDEHGEKEITDALQACARIEDLMPLADEPRFSIHDYVDGIANARRCVSLAKLMALPDHRFMAALVWLAEDKRETYEERAHEQAPLEEDIYE